MLLDETLIWSKQRWIEAKGIVNWFDLIYAHAMKVVVANVAFIPSNNTNCMIFAIAQLEESN
jgi:hypothetical protein